MAKPVLNRKKAKFIALLFFLIALAIVTYFGAWWPGIMLVVGLPLAIMQYLQGRHYDMGVTLFVFLGAWVTVAFQIQWEYLLPILFAIGGLYLLAREWLESRPEEEEEFEEDKDESSKDDSEKD